MQRFATIAREEEQAVRAALKNCRTHNVILPAFRWLRYVLDPANPCGLSRGARRLFVEDSSRDGSKPMLGRLSKTFLLA